MEIFDSEAKLYDSWYNTALGNYVLTKESNLLLSMVGNTSNQRILDVGCATGIHTKLFAKNGNEVTGVDISQDMINEARKIDIPNLSFYKMDATKLEFADNSFDLIISATMIEFIKNRNGFINEVFRVLKPGGRFVLGTIQKHSHFYNLYMTPFFQENTVFKYADFLSNEDLINLHDKFYVRSSECLFNEPQKIEDNPEIHDNKTDLVGSFIVAEYIKGEE